MKEEINLSITEKTPINERINFRTLLFAIYLTLYRKGYKTISLKQDDIKEYIEKLEKIFDDYNINSEELFVRTPVLETYDKYGDYLIQLFLSSNIGDMNRRYDTIILECKDYFIQKRLAQMTEYNDIINSCCEAIIGEEYNDDPISESEKSNQRIKR